MFEGGLYNYDKYEYVDDAGSTRLQGVCIVISLTPAAILPSFFQCKRYINAGHTSYIKDITSDITISDCDSPNGSVAGSRYSITGNIASQYNRIKKTVVRIHRGFGTSGSTVAGHQNTVSGKAYNLLNSNVHYNTTFSSVGVGNYTYATTVLEVPTCTESGVSVKSCGNCGYVTQMNIKAVGHQYSA